MLVLGEQQNQRNVGSSSEKVGHLNPLHINKCGKLATVEFGFAACSEGSIHILRAELL